MDEKPEFDPELWLEYLLAVMPDTENRENLIKKLSEKSGISEADVEDVLHVLMQHLVENIRSN